jgi:hypothetical protein
MPVAAGNMNYVSAVYFVVVLIMWTDWLIRGRKSYRGQALRHEEAEIVATRTASMSTSYGARRRSSVVWSRDGDFSMKQYLIRRQ